MTTEHSYGVLGIHDGFGCEIVAGSAEGYFLRTQGTSGLTRYGRIESEHLDKDIIKTDHLGNGVVTSDKIKSIVPEQIYSDTHKDHYGVMVFSNGKAHFIDGPTDKGAFLRTKINESGLPSFGRIEVDDLPQSSHPVYMARWQSGSKQTEYNPYGYVTSFSQRSGHVGMLLEFDSRYSVNDFILSANSLQYDDNAAARPLIIHRTKEGVTYLPTDHGYLVIYKI